MIGVQFNRFLLAMTFGCLFFSGGMDSPLFADDGSRIVKYVNSTDDLPKVRLFLLHADGRLFQEDLNRGQAVEHSTRVGERVAVAYTLDGKLLDIKKFPLRPGDEPASVGVFGNATGGYRIDVGL